MFGYTVPFKPEMKIKEYTKYRAYYCGVCKSIKDIAGNLCRMTLTYDATLLAILLSEINGSNEDITAQRCMVHPVKKRPMLVTNEAVEWAAAVNVLLAYEKMRDDWRDERKVIAASASLAMHTGRKKVSRAFPKLATLSEQYTKKQIECEQNRSKLMDEAAQPTAEYMQGIVELYAKTYGVNKIITEKASWIGYNIGKWIYLIDAFDDIADDLKSNSYNVFIEKVGSNKQAEQIKNEVKQTVLFSAQMCIAEAGSTFNELNIERNSAIIDNIIALGMDNKTKEIVGVDV